MGCTKDWLAIQWGVYQSGSHMGQATVLATSRPQWTIDGVGVAVLTTSRPQWAVDGVGVAVLTTSRPQWVVHFVG